jgi:hypothetical protein
VWASDESLRIQLSTLLLLCPEEVESWWGGTMDDMFELETLDEAVLHLSMYLEDKDFTGVWISRKDDRMPFMETNVLLSSKPDVVFMRYAKGTVEVEGQLMSMKELCSIGQVNASELLLLMYEMGTTDDLLINLMEHK